ncbi:hypothetical protein B9Z19DRAFT_1092416 [Tuber borchii]|uniref:Uncharacterized protein n=1 Tax=Tuber borchii TaxID=42251 RepID=A0A2T6ZGH1_TUBBO|nr:hypothetical protein B9Z19DRAFT_1092416 [Tuber borchii]
MKHAWSVFHIYSVLRIIAPPALCYHRPLKQPNRPQASLSHPSIYPSSHLIPSNPKPRPKRGGSRES